MSDSPIPRPGSPVKASSKENADLSAPSPSTPWSRVAVDANFFILAFAQNPSQLSHFKQIADRLSFQLYTSPQILEELRWNLRRRVQEIVQIVEVTKEELQAYIQKAKGLMDRIPQAPDLSLLIVLKKLGENRLVSSDFYLLQSLRSLEPEIEGLMGSAFLLHLLERSLENEEDTAFLEELRERVLHTEIKYSLTRSSVYDPTARIKLIENQAFHIVRSLRGPRIAEEDLVGMTAREALGLRTFLLELRRSYATLVHQIQERNYREVLVEVAEARDELYNHLVILGWELSATAHRKLLRQITPDMVLLNYLTALLNLYLGEQVNLLKAKQAIDECNRILIAVRPDTATYRRLMVMTHLLRITINLLWEDFDSATMYFSMFTRKCQEWGFTNEHATAQALYLALLVIRGEITSTEFPHVTDAEEVIRFLVDLSSLYFVLQRFNEAWHLLRQVIYIVQYFKLIDALEPTLQQMILVYYAEARKRKAEFSSFLNLLRQWLETNGYDTTLVKPFQKEVAGRTTPSLDYFTKRSRLPEKLHPNLLDWMTVIDRVEIAKPRGSVLVCRTWKLHWNIGLLIQEALLEGKAKRGEQVRLGEGKFKVTSPPPLLKRRYRVLALIRADPRAKTRIYVRGGEGFRLLQVDPLLDKHRT